jgi:arylsulfatase A-like enzyme
MQPNILFVFADQLRYSALACNGNRVVWTPCLDRLAREGVVFDQAYSSCPICSPYRAQILTGRYAHANGVIDNEYALFAGETTLAHVLCEAGYRTAYVGKWHLGYPPYTASKRYGFDDLYAYNCTHRYYNVSYWHNEEGPYPMVGFAPEVETQLALDAIEAHTRERPDQPFCLLLSWGPPHWSTVDGVRDYGEYPQQYDVYDPQQIDVPGNVPRQFETFVQREMADYYAMVTALDDYMGRILDALDEWGLAENTIVCFSSDHGDHLGAHGYGKPGPADAWMRHTLQLSKGTPLEESAHIPLLLRYPARFRGNRRTGTMLNSVDVMPTLLALCDVAVPEAVQGVDLSHAALGMPGEDPDSVYLQMLGPGWPDRVKSVGLWRAVRTERYTYARWADCGGKRLLYDRGRDSLEMCNLIDDPAYADVVERLEQRLRRWIEETEDPFDTGQRLPQTEMLALDQAFISARWYDLAPQAYAEAISGEEQRLETDG